MLNATTVTVGSGKAIHWGTEGGTMCGAAHRNGFFTAPKIVKAAEVTCKRCIKAMAARVEADHAEALIDNAKHDDAQAVAIADVQGGTQWIATDGGVAVQVTRIAADPFPRVSFRRADGQTGTLPLAWFVERYTPAHNIEDAHLEALHTDAVRDHFAAAAEELKADDLNRSAKLLTLLRTPLRVRIGRHVAYRLRDTRTGATYLIHGTTPAANAPHLTTVWVQREGDQGVRGWSLDMLCSTWHDLVAA